MVRTAVTRESENMSAFLRSVRGETLPYRQILDLLNPLVPFTEAMIVSSLPRGGLQIVQPPRLPEPLVRAYGKELHAYDRLTWQAIAREAPLRAREAWPAEQYDSNRYRRDIMDANGFAYGVAVPLAAPVLNGYPGALHLYRTPALGEFTDEELSRLREFAAQLDEAVARTRAARIGEPAGEDVLPPRPPVHEFIFDAHLHLPLPQADPAVLDENLHKSILDDARRRLDHVNGHAVLADRVPLPDSRGDLWNFRVVTHGSYPALSDGPVVFFCLQPACGDWSALRSSDFQADHEVARLIPALRFMREQFQRGPTLVEISKTVHLSPFHFHRRFTELLGITPKHFLLDCQIEQAKQELLSKQKELVKIATECGFAHQSHFTSRFKQATGLTPTRWRRMAASDAHGLSHN